MRRRPASRSAPTSPAPAPPHLWTWTWTWAWAWWWGWSSGEVPGGAAVGGVEADRRLAVLGVPVPQALLPGDPGQVVGAGGVRVGVKGLGEGLPRHPGLAGVPDADLPAV